MTDWGAHHFGGATFICDVRELQPEEVIYHDDKEGRYLAYRYPNGLILYHNHPHSQNMQIEGTPGEKLPPKPVPIYQGTGGIGGDFIHCVKTREKPFRDAARQEFPGDVGANRLVDRARREPWQV
jgi:hypothetical protein